MAREGIYVGGHEIVERYVGSKLVWQKWRFLKRFSNLFYAEVYQYDKTQVQISGQHESLQNVTFDTNTSKVKVINYTNSGTAVVYAKSVHVYSSSSGTNNYNDSRSIYISFNTQEEASNFVKQYRYVKTIDIYI